MFDAMLRRVNRPAVALVLLVLELFLLFGVRTVQQLRMTGATGFHGIRGPVGSPEWAGGVLFVVALALAGIAPIAELVGWVDPIVVPTASVAWLGVAIVVTSVLATYWAQLAMGRSWRIGVDAGERTALVTDGPFRWVRNPIFTGMLASGAGLVLLLPNALAIAAFAALLVAVELQVRFVEEPYLRRTHGEAYAAYCRRVGRLVPGLGRE
jgi:protein-S-isoprenylcysteine O-methyltransferase Ste14